MKQSILYGNGVNLLTKGNPSWKDLINEISKITIEGNIPNPIKYEAILLNDYKNSNWEDSNTINETADINDAKKEQESDLKKKIAKRLEEFESNEIYRKIFEMPFEHFMTTNYDKSLIKDLEENLFVSKNTTEKLYSIRRSYMIKTSENDSNGRLYWPIHGYFKNWPSIMLGYDQYCGSLAKIDSYVKGNYKYDKNDEEPIKSIKKRLAKEEWGDIKSWIDLFFISDVHIIGLGLSYEEIDLWWILNRRKRIMTHTNVSNRVYYYQTEEEDNEKEQIFKIFGVEYVPLKNKKLFNNTKDYTSRYDAQLVEMKKRMDERANM